MTDNENYYDLMDDYLKGKLPGDQQVLFEKQLQNDPAFAEEFEIHKNLLTGIRNQGKLELKNDLKKIHEETIRPATKIRKLRMALAIAASIAILVSTGIWYFVSQPISQEQLFANYFEVYQTSLGVRAKNINKELLDAESAYMKGNYKIALPVFLEYQKSGEYSSQIHLATGICFLELNQLDKAKNQFEIILEKNDPYFIDLAHWFTALTFLKENKVMESKTILEKLADDPEADMHQEAKDLLRSLNKS